MKNLLIGFFLCFSCALCAQQYSVDARGEKQFDPLYKWGGYSGSEFILGVGMVNSPNKNAFGDKYGSSGVSAGATLLVDMSEYVSSGVDYLYGGLRSADGSNGMKQTLEGNHIFAMFKIKLNPKDRLRLYIPVGLGGSNLKVETVDRSVGWKAGETRWGFAMFAGLGLEIDVSSTVSVGVEYRYLFPFVQESDIDLMRGSNQYFQMHHFMFRVGMRLF